MFESCQIWDESKKGGFPSHDRITQCKSARLVTQQLLKILLKSVPPFECDFSTSFAQLHLFWVESTVKKLCLPFSKGTFTLRRCVTHTGEGYVGPNQFTECQNNQPPCHKGLSTKHYHPKHGFESSFFYERRFSQQNIERSKIYSPRFSTLSFRRYFSHLLLLTVQSSVSRINLGNGTIRPWLEFKKLHRYRRKMSYPKTTKEFGAVKETVLMQG